METQRAGLSPIRTRELEGLFLPPRKIFKERIASRLVKAPAATRPARRRRPVGGMSFQARWETSLFMSTGSAAVNLTAFSALPLPIGGVVGAFAIACLVNRYDIATCHSLVRPRYSRLVCSPQAEGHALPTSMKMSRVVHHSKIGLQMSALGHKRTKCLAWALSALPPKADINAPARPTRMVVLTSGNEEHDHAGP